MKARLLPALFAGLLLGAACGRSNLDDLLLEEGDGGSRSGGAGGQGGKGGTSASGGAGGLAGGGGAGAQAGGTGKGGAAGFAGSAGTVDAGSDAPLSCGDGALDPGEQCDLGASNALSPALELRQGSLSLPVTPLVTSGSVQAFYGFESASSQTGYEELAKSRLMFHRSDFDLSLSLVMHHGVDYDATGILQPMSEVFFSVTGLPATAVVAVSDDPGEVQKVSAAVVNGDWRFNANSDGGAIGGLPFPGAWTVVVNPSFITGVEAWDFVDGSAEYVALATSASVELVARDVPSSCRPDCTIPLCGDGVLDGGEVCDDGNSIAGDGCSACLPD